MKSLLNFKTLGLFTLSICIGLGVSCSKKEQVLGRWYNPVTEQGVEQGIALYAFHQKDTANISGKGQDIRTAKNGFFSFEKPKSDKGMVTLSFTKFDQDLIYFPNENLELTPDELNKRIELFVFRPKNGRVVMNGLDSYSSEEYVLNIDLIHEYLGKRVNIYRSNGANFSIHKETEMIRMAEGKITLEGTFTLNGQTTTINKVVDWSLAPNTSDSIVLNL